MPETINGDLYLDCLTSAEGLIIPDSLDCELICPLSNNNLDTLREMTKQKRK